MRWRRARRSDNVQDRRHIGGRRGLAVGGIGGVVVLVIALLFGFDPSMLLNTGGGFSSARPPVASSASDEELVQFVRAVLGDTEDTWHAVFEANGKRYREPGLVLFHESVDSACGFASAAVGPFYCPSDGTVYIDLRFFRTLRDELGAAGDFAQAYVIAHEVGHHVQSLLGTSAKVRAQQTRRPGDANELSVRLELQADYFAGVWAHHAMARGLVEPGDFEEALRAAAAIGDDTLQRRGQGYVVPESFTHGTSEQRTRWFRLGIEHGDLAHGDTFAAREL